MLLALLLSMDILRALFLILTLECPVENPIRLKSQIADKWSFLNRLLMYCNNTKDARGFNQWKQAGRYIIKGSHAFYILAPMFKKVIDKKTSEEKQIIAGFKAVPVFRFEDTDGAPIIRKFKIEYTFWIQWYHSRTEATPAEIAVRRASVLFSRRTAQAMNSRHFMSYTVKHRSKIMNTIMALGNFGTFEQLPDWLQQAIIQSESPSTGAGYEEVPGDESWKWTSGISYTPAVKGTSNGELKEKNTKGFDLSVCWWAQTNVYGAMTKIYWNKMSDKKNIG